MNIKILGKDLHDLSKFVKDEYIKIIADDKGIKVYTVVNNIEILKNIKGEVFEQGSTITSAVILNVIPSEEVTITDNEIYSDNTSIKYDQSDIKMAYRECDNAEVLVSELKNEKLRDILEIKYAIAKDECRPVLQNICLTENKAVALDGYRMAIRVTNFNLKEDILIPIKVIKMLSKLKGDGSIIKQGENIIFNIGEYSVKFYSSDEEFIKYESILPKDRSIKCTLDSRKVLSILKKAIKLSTGWNCMSTFALSEKDNNALSINVERLDIKFQEKIIQSSCNDNLNIAFNMKYLIDSFKHFPGEVSMEFESSVAPVLLKTENKLDLLLPIRLAK